MLSWGGKHHAPILASPIRATTLLLDLQPTFILPGDVGHQADSVLDSSIRASRYSEQSEEADHPE